MKFTSRKKVGECIILKKIINGRRTFKCKGIKRLPTAQEIIDSINTKRR